MKDKTLDNLLERIISFNSYLNDYKYKSINKNPNHYNCQISHFGYDTSRVKEIVKNFLKTLEDNFKQSDMASIYSKINSLHIIKTDNLDNPNANAEYSIVDNTIYVRKESKSTLPHELFHAASKKDDDTTGFEMMIDDQKHYVGLNEGYTELLAIKYFNDTYDAEVSYYIEAVFTSMMENIVGVELMENLYLQGNTKALLNELEKYLDNIKINTLMDLLDYVCYEFLYNNNINPDDVNNAIKQIYIYLVESYIRKQRILYRQKEISIDKALIDINDFINVYNIGVTYNDNVYRTTTEDIINNILSNNLVGVNRKK